MKTAIVHAGSRLHLGLFDLGGATSRTFGGAGFMIESPLTTVEAHVSNETVVQGASLSADTVAVVTQRVQAFVTRFALRPVAVEVKANAREHVGLGSKTSVVLAALAAAANACSAPIDQSELQLSSGRGGASGVGITGFFTGGFLIDAGHRGRMPWLPSAQQRPTSVPPVIARISVPEGWHFTLFMPEGRRLSGAAEVAFFEHVTPIPQPEVYQQVTLAYHVLAPAVLDDDLEGFGEALEHFSRIGLKAREIANQDPCVSETMEKLRAVAPCVGMSSMGPLVFTISRSPLHDLPDLCPRVELIGRTRCAEGGYRLRDG